MARIDLGKVVGESATIEVGKVTTLEPEQSATVQNVGTSLNGIFDFGIPKGQKGEKGDTGSQGPVGPQGAQGKPFIVAKTYSSVLDMEADFNNMEVGDYVMIASNVESEDNARLYYRDTNEWKFISDFSGATGIQGEQGPQGQAGYTPVKGVDYFTSADIAEIEGDIKEITGELANLDTTDKSNLVSAINEVASSSGASEAKALRFPSSSDTKYHYYVIKQNTSGQPSLDSSSLKPQIIEVINDYIQNFDTNYTYNHIMIDVRTALTNLGCTFYIENWASSEPMFTSSTTYNQYYSYYTRTIIRPVYIDGVCTDYTATSGGGMNMINDAPLVKNNTYRFTPTGDYNPATKKYVDDSIASAITSALGGSY